MRNFVLVHSPLVGPLTWQPAADLLRARGHTAIVAAVTGVTDHAGFVRTVADAVTGTGPYTLVGHSGAGALLPAIAAALGPRIESAVFVDALLPHPGRSWFDTAPAELCDELRAMARDGHLPPWHEWLPPDTLAEIMPDDDLRARFVAEIPRLPLAYFAEPAPETPDWSGVRRGYVRLSAAYDDFAADAGRLGWPVSRLDLDHLAVCTRPAPVVAAMLSVADQSGHSGTTGSQ